jgi:hypothetical protein
MSYLLELTQVSLFYDLIIFLVLCVIFLPLGIEAPIAVIIVYIILWTIGWWNSSDSAKLFILTNKLRYIESELCISTVDDYCEPFRKEVYISYQNYSEIQDWVYDIDEHESFSEPVNVIYGKFEDIEDRLNTALENRAKLKEKYGEEYSTVKIDKDIEHLNSLGWQLVEPTQKFFELTKQHMMEIDEANARAEAMHGLKTFTQEIEIAGNQPSEALEKSVADIEIAINNLEKELNK